jgi:hypothetical protein
MSYPPAAKLSLSFRRGGGGALRGRREMNTFLNEIRESFHFGTIADSKMMVTPVSAVR